MLEKLPVQKWKIGSRKFSKLVVAHHCNTGTVRGSFRDTESYDMAGKTYQERRERSTNYPSSRLASVKHYQPDPKNDKVLHVAKASSGNSRFFKHTREERYGLRAD